MVRAYAPCVHRVWPSHGGIQGLRPFRSGESEVISTVALGRVVSCLLLIMEEEPRFLKIVYACWLTITFWWAPVHHDCVLKLPAGLRPGPGARLVRKGVGCFWPVPLQLWPHGAYIHTVQQRKKLG